MTSREQNYKYVLRLLIMNLPMRQWQSPHRVYIEIGWKTTKKSIWDPRSFWKKKIEEFLNILCVSGIWQINTIIKENIWLLENYTAMKNVNFAKRQKKEKYLGAWYHFRIYCRYNIFISIWIYNAVVYDIIRIILVYGL